MNPRCNWFVACRACRSQNHRRICTDFVACRACRSANRHRACNGRDVACDGRSNHRRRACTRSVACRACSSANRRRVGTGRVACRARKCLCRYTAYSSTAVSHVRSPSCSWRRQKTPRINRELYERFGCTYDFIYFGVMSTTTDNGLHSITSCGKPP